jgi:hypothetical protein
MADRGGEDEEGAVGVAAGEGLPRLIVQSGRFCGAGGARWRWECEGKFVGSRISSRGASEVSVYEVEDNRA